MDTPYPLPTLLQTGLSVVLFFFPLMLLTVWATLALADVGGRSDLSTGGRFGWSAAIVAIPWLGAAAYHAVGRSKLPAPLRTVMLVGGVATYLVLLGLGRMVGGVS